MNSALETLANYRANNTRASSDIVHKGKALLQNKSALGDQVWQFLEQFFLAAIDVGDLALADTCLTALVDKFPDSPRVDILQGIRLEAASLPERPERALQYYDELLSEDESNAAAWKRKISILNSTLPSPPTPASLTPLLNELTTYLDTFYTDIPSWLLLTSLYSSIGQYTRAFQALSHVLVLNPKNAWMVLQAAGVAWDAGDIWGAMRMWLRAGEMAVEDLEIGGVLDPNERGEEEDKLSLRCWYGVKLCTRTILASDSGKKYDSTHPLTQSKPMSEEHVKLLDQLATERLLALYPASGSKGRKEVLEWVSSNA